MDVNEENFVKIILDLPRHGYPVLGYNKAKGGF